MKLFGILCWWDESPTWLAATVTSMAKVGVDHVVALDGRYPLFERRKPVASRPDQVEAIHLAAYAAGMGVTIHQPDPHGALDETQKRTLGFRIVETLGTPFEDWCLILDADELIRTGTPRLRHELAALDADTHVMRAAVTNGEDHDADPAADNDVTPQTAAIARVHPVPSEFSAMQSRCFRVLHGMNTGSNHWMYNGIDQQGRPVYLRDDTGRADPDAGYLVSPQANPAERFEILHRKNHRTLHRQQTKVAYYRDRDTLGIETFDLPPVATA